MYIIYYSRSRSRMAAALRRASISSSEVSGALILELNRATVSGWASMRTSRERAEPGVFLRTPLATRLSMCSATAETDERPRPVMISR